MKGYLIDLDGTLYRGNEPIPHAAAFIANLHRNQLPYLLVTNNSSRTSEQVSLHLAELGIDVPPGFIYTSSQAAAQYLLEHPENPERSEYAERRRVAVIGETGLKTALEAAGFELTEDNPETLVQGIDRDFTYAKLTAAVNHLRAGALYVLTNPDHMLPSGPGFMPGAGSLAAAITTASGVQPVIIGKPSPIIMNYAIRKLGLAASDVWVIGDNADTDIKGGELAGCKTALVLTGVATSDNVKEQLSRAGVQPHLICKDLHEFSLEVFGNSYRPPSSL
ncbi:HAD-IIA family hydrolase [Paenibacillus eucommiae]|uniref:Acid sugar phosphatase n=1 Tax=Paenibacillus eucommiae TaxID=1355755 RepID=A0ABS4J2N8_9BACL|nr:HAD-IIA family hydrolase [Paenibacillus eucommiae]MBP1993371.1 4-nitrophenyl phosphatase [Paenibacillus eucommiae]